MRTSFPTDPALAGLQSLTESDLARITGQGPVEVLRLRHHPGLRAALHVAYGPGKHRHQGVIWFLSPTKLTHLKATRPHLRIDAARSAAFEAFPMDHRLPELAAFLDCSDVLAPMLIGGSARALPQLVRYRPGLSATFLWLSDKGARYFVKVARKMDSLAHAELQGHLRRQIEGSMLTLPAVTGCIGDRGLIAYAAAQGESLEHLMALGDAEVITDAVSRCHEALQVLWTCDAPELLGMEVEDYLGPARRAAALIAEADAEAGALAKEIIASRETTAPTLRKVPIHADLKPDHLFLEPSRVTLIDTESLKRGDPDFDLALLDARLDLGPLTGTFSDAAVVAARQVMRAAAGPNTEWFQGLARIQAAKFLAQNIGSGASANILKILTP